MEVSDILKKVRHIEIKARVLSQQVFAGHYHSAFKGTGLAFSEVREYSYGDDIRAIDWKVTARFNHPYIKLYEEERELTVLLLIDVSASNRFGTRQHLKTDLITEIASVLAFSAIINNDKVGVIYFSNQVEKFIPPQKGSTHILRVIRETLDFQPKNKLTAIKSAVEFLLNAIKKSSIVFILSDFIDKDYEPSLLLAAQKHDLILLKIEDPKEKELPPIGYVHLTDPETGRLAYVDTENLNTRIKYARWWQSINDRFFDFCTKTGTDYAVLQTGSDYVKALLQLFKEREKRR